jgi:hypothetical protein
MRLGTKWVLVPKTFCLPAPARHTTAMKAVGCKRQEEVTRMRALSFRGELCAKLSL